MSYHPAKNMNGPIRFPSISKKNSVDRILLKSITCDRNTCKCILRTEQTTRKEEHIHGWNQHNRDQKITLSHCFPVIWRTAGALGNAEFEKVLGERIFLHPVLMKHVWEAVGKRSCLGTVASAQTCTQNNTDRRRGNNSLEKGIALDNPHSRYSKETLFSQSTLPSIV